ncbi:MAG: hypothetical protein ACRDH6_09475 [Actinomycetota bacterium]
MTKRRRDRGVPFLLFSLVVVGMMIVALASTQVLVAQTSLRANKLNERAEQLSSASDRLRLRLAELSSPDNIVRAARRAGLVLPREVRLLYVPMPGAERPPSPQAPSGTLAFEEAPGGSG